VSSVIELKTFYELKDAMGGGFIGELIDTYCDETPQLIPQLKQSLAKGDAEAFRRAAHSIKSSSASFGALEFSAQAKELEMIGKAGDLSAASKVDSLANEYIQVAQTLQELIHES
jgi:histidine phosphotransfer protein HptB